MAYWLYQNIVQTGSLIVPLHSIGTATTLQAQIVVEEGEVLRNAYLCIVDSALAGHVLARINNSSVYRSIMPEIDPNCYIGTLFAGQTVNVEIQLDFPADYESNQYDIQILLRHDLALPGAPNSTFFGGAYTDLPMWGDDEAEVPLWRDGYGDAPYFESGSICRKKVYGRLLPDTGYEPALGHVVYAKVSGESRVIAQAKNNGKMSEAAVLGIVDNAAINYAYKTFGALATDAATNVYWAGGVESPSTLVRLDWATKQWFSCVDSVWSLYGASLTYCNSMFWLFGGIHTATGLPSATLYKYDPATNLGTAIGVGPRARSYHAAIPYGNDIHFVGGSNSEGNVLIVDIYNTVTGIWRTGASTPAAFAGFTYGSTEATTPEFFVCDTAIFFGDFNAKATGIYYTYAADTEEFSDPSTLIAETPARGTFPTRPLRASDVKQQNFGRIAPYGVNGCTYWVGLGEAICRFYSEDTGYWYTADVHTRRFLKEGFVTNAAWSLTLGNQYYLGAGGTFGSRPASDAYYKILVGKGVSTTTLCFRPDYRLKLAWARTTNSAIAFNPTVALYECGGAVDDIPVAFAQYYDYATETWIALPDMPYAVTAAGATYINGYVVVVGGLLADGSASPYIQYLNLDTNIWSTATLPKGLILPMVIATARASSTDLYTELGMPIPGGYPGSWAYSEGHIVGGSSGVGFISGLGANGAAGAGAITGGYGTVEGRGSGGIVGEDPSESICYDITPGECLGVVGGNYATGDNVGKTPADIYAEDTNYQENIFGTENDEESGGETGGTGTYSSGSVGSYLAGSGLSGGSSSTGGYGGSSGTPIIFGGQVNYAIGSGTSDTDGQGSGGGTGGGSSGPNSDGYTPGGALPGQSEQVVPDDNKGTGDTAIPVTNDTVVIDAGITDDAELNDDIWVFDPDTGELVEVGDLTGGNDVSIIPSSDPAMLEIIRASTTDWPDTECRCPFLKIGTKLYLWVYDLSKMLEFDTVNNTVTSYDLEFADSPSPPQYAEAYNGAVYLFYLNPPGDFGDCAILLDVYRWVPGSAPAVETNISVNTTAEFGSASYPTASVLVGGSVYFYCSSGFCEMGIDGRLVYRYVISTKQMHIYDFTSTGDMPNTATFGSGGLTTDDTFVYTRGGTGITEENDLFQRINAPNYLSSWGAPAALDVQITNNCMCYDSGKIYSALGTTEGDYPHVDVYTISTDSWGQFESVVSLYNETGDSFTVLVDRLQMIGNNLYFACLIFDTEDNRHYGLFAIDISGSGSGGSIYTQLTGTVTKLPELGVNIDLYISPSIASVSSKKSKNTQKGDGNDRGSSSSGSTTGDASSTEGYTTDIYLNEVKVTLLQTANGSVTVIDASAY